MFVRDWLARGLSMKRIGVHRWSVKDVSNIGEGPMYDIDIGKHVLRMVTEDYQMACDICDAHNDTLDPSPCSDLSEEGQ